MDGPHTLHDLWDLFGSRIGDMHSALNELEGALVELATLGLVRWQYEPDFGIAASERRIDFSVEALHRDLALIAPGFEIAPKVSRRATLDFSATDRAAAVAFDPVYEAYQQQLSRDFGWD